MRLTERQNGHDVSIKNAMDACVSSSSIRTSVMCASKFGLLGYSSYLKLMPGAQALVMQSFPEPES